MNEHERRDDLTPEIAQAEHAEPAAVAREQFAHGILESHQLDRPADTDRRITALMSRLEAPRPMRAAPKRVRRWPLMSGLAAVLALSGLVILSLPTQGSALQMVQASIEASKTAGDRRYEIKVSLPNTTDGTLDKIATLDVRDPEHYVVEARSPYGDRVVMGRTPEGSWAIRPDGSADRYPPKHVLPPWIDFGTSTVMLVSVDDLLHTLRQSYDLKRDESAPLPDKGEMCQRITATRQRGATAPGPRRVQMWLDAQTHIVKRMELSWDPPAGPRGGPGAHERPGPAPENGPAPRGPRDGRRPPPDMMDDDLGPPPDRIDGDGSPAGERRPPGPRQRRGDGPMGPPPNELDGQGPPPEEGGPPPRMRPRPNPSGPDGPDGPRRGPGPRGPRRGPAPEFLDGPPDFTRHPAPPRTLVFDLVEAQGFAEDWFGAEAHLKKDDAKTPEAPTPR